YLHRPPRPSLAPSPVLSSRGMALTKHERDLADPPRGPRAPRELSASECRDHARPETLPTSPSPRCRSRIPEAPAKGLGEERGEPRHDRHSSPGTATGWSRHKNQK